MARSRRPLFQIFDYTAVFRRRDIPAKTCWKRCCPKARAASLSVAGKGEVIVRKYRTKVASSSVAIATSRSRRPSVLFCALAAELEDWSECQIGLKCRL